MIIDKVFYLSILFSVPSTQQQSTYLIASGHKSKPNQFAHQVSLRLHHTTHFCGGAVINIQFVLTAAHCMTPLIQYNYRNMSVMLGAETMNEMAQEYQVCSVSIHPKYKDNNAINDIALIKLTNEIKFTKSIQPIRLNTNMLIAGTHGIVSGFGVTNFETKTFTNSLTYTIQTILPGEKCIDNGTVSPYEFCANAAYGVGTCVGDSGGPMIQHGLLIGIVSHGTPCALGQSDYYTNVSYYDSWIKKQMQIM